MRRVDTHETNAMFRWSTPGVSVRTSGAWASGLEQRGRPALLPGAFARRAPHRLGLNRADPSSNPLGAYTSCGRHRRQGVPVHDRGRRTVRAPRRRSANSQSLVCSRYGAGVCPHAVVRPAFAAAGWKLRDRSLPQRKERRDQRKAEQQQQRGGNQTAHALIVNQFRSKD